MSGLLKSKRPAEVLDYDVSYAQWLSDNDTISTATAEVTESTAVIVRVEFSETAAKVWLSGGADGETAHVTVTANTAEGRVKEYCFRIRIRECC